MANLAVRYDSAITITGGQGRKRAGKALWQKEVCAMTGSKHLTRTRRDGLSLPYQYHGLAV